MTEEVGVNGRSHRWGKASANGRDVSFLSETRDILSDIIRANHIWLEFVRGYYTFRKVGPCVTVFGSARFSENHPYYALAREMGKLLAQTGFAVMTGGGPGIMEAANRGAKDAGGYSIGCNIQLPFEQHPNSFLDRWVTFKNFFVRKVMLIKYSYAFVVPPGGIGTLDEVFETLTLIQTKKIESFPIILLGKDYWSGLKEMVTERLLAAGTVSREDLKLLHYTDSPEEALRCIKSCGSSKFGLHFDEPSPHCDLCAAVDI